MVHLRLYNEIQTHQGRERHPKTHLAAHPQSQYKPGEGANPPETPPVAPPTVLNSTEWILKHVRITVLTSAAKSYQRQKIHLQLRSWLKPFYDIVTVISDSNDNLSGDKLPIPGFVNSYATEFKCDSSYQVGLWCKNKLMIHRWKAHPDYNKDVRWYIRLMDDTYVHEENLAALLSSIPHSDKPTYIGDQWCHDTNHSYLYGGSGMVFNKAVLETFDDDLWESIPGRYSGLQNLDDLCWGAYMTHTSPVNLIHHHGFTHIDSSRLEHEIWELVTRDHVQSPWPLVMIHLAHDAYIRMEDVHRMIHEADPLLKFKAGVSDAVPAPCNCVPGFHSRCLARKAFLQDSECRWVGYKWRCYFAA